MIIPNTNKIVLNKIVLNNLQLLRVTYNSCVYFIKFLKEIYVIKKQGRYKP